MSWDVIHDPFVEPFYTRRQRRVKEACGSRSRGWEDAAVVSRLEAALSAALLVVLVCRLAGWESAGAVAAVPFLALLLASVRPDRLETTYDPRGAPASLARIERT
jgi:hypothetical protein